MCSYSQLCIQLRCISSWKLAVMEIFTPWKLINTTISHPYSQNRLQHANAVKDIQ